MVRQIESLSEFRELINSGKVVVADFWAEWCPPCKAIGPYFEQLAVRHGKEDVVFVKIDVDKQQEVAQEVGIAAMPTFMVFKDGDKVDELVGAHPGKLDEMCAKSR